MRLILAVPLALLAACNGGADNRAAEAGGNAGAPEAAANVSKPDGGANASAAIDPARAGEIQECVADVAPELPAGTDLNAFCGCAVDRMQSTGAGEREAMEACAAQMGIEPR